MTIEQLRSRRRFREQRAVVERHERAIQAQREADLKREVEQMAAAWVFRNSLIAVGAFV